MPSISVVIPTKDRESILVNSLDKLLKADPDQRFEIIVINDSENPILLPESFAERVKVERNKGRGVASARNTGAELSAANWLWFLDDDMWVNRLLADRVQQHISSGTHEIGRASCRERV